MNIVTELSPTVKQQFDAAYAEMVFNEMIRSARRAYIQMGLDGLPRMPWADFVAVYGRVWGNHHEVDLSSFAVPDEPVVPDAAFEQWVAQMESEFGDMADAQVQQRTGMPMF